MGTIKQYTFGWDSRLTKIRQELASAVSEPVVLTGHLKELLTSLREGANLGAKAETRPADEAEIKSLRADVAAGSEMHSSDADDHIADDPEVD